MSQPAGKMPARRVSPSYRIIPNVARAGMVFGTQNVTEPTEALVGTPAVSGFTRFSPMIGYNRSNMSYHSGKIPSHD
jgi:hypothetical protein